MRLVISLLMFVTATLAQSITFGVKGGVPLTDNFEAENGGGPGYSETYSSKTRRYTVGPTVTLNLPHRLGIEVDALYRRLDYDRFSTGLADATTFSQWERTTGNRIDVPVLLRWSPIKRVYAVAGPTFGFHANVTTMEHTISDTPYVGHSDSDTTINDPGELHSHVGKGITVGVGLDNAVGWLHIKPELRYTNWIGPAFETSGFLRQKTNDLVFLLGFEFGAMR
jgi:Outer membrane protein beta-barrel domain